MFKKTLTAAIAALTLAGATLTAPSSAQAGGLGKFIAAGIVGSAIASNARSAPAYRPAHGGYDEGCGFRVRPVFDAFGHQVAVRRVPAC